ncbi:hemolysin-type calcium-binding repeat 2 copies family protein [Asticcacaulis biprosthecium C19]|uniref:Hemolysin-type calcium-binding repeat 2 copies family protein n=1 Tax=Asticcacaulis biprosthecium C19 TaxID=715226 RepID=F4QTK2_9CAUL|nr:polysaccharide lyase family 7 protein [Asticcacaulis biprosthecium]EGF90072.1 hemolysin-type calcium-binding repeat 2 copies family protein [Asticcacaulis biprosthecium C19]
MNFNSDDFDLTHWKLTLPVDSDGENDGKAVEVLNLVGYSDDRFFYVAPDGAMVFRAAVEGATTTGSTYARSELREMRNGGLAAWGLNEGGTLTATLSVNRTPVLADGTPGRIIVGQVHGESQELACLYYDNGTVYFVNEQAGTSDIETKFELLNAAGEVADIDLGEKFSYYISAKDDLLIVRVYADGDTYESITKISNAWADDSFYFKSGVYLGVNETKGTGVGIAAFYALDFGHGAGAGLGGLASIALSHVAVSLSGTAKDDVLRGGDDIDILYGLNGDDILNGSDGNDKLYGGGGIDRLHGGAGADSMFGGDGDDVYIVDNVSDRVVEYIREGADIVYASVSYALSVNVETLKLTGTNDINATGTRNGDVLTGNQGANLLDGGAGNDQMQGLEGNDTYFVDAAGDKVVEMVRAGTDQVVSSVSYKLTANVEHLTLTGSALTGTSNDLNNRLLGNAENNTLTALAGDDTLDGGTGADTMAGGLGNDSYYVDNELDKIVEISTGGFEVVRTSASIVLSNYLEDVYIVAAGVISATGNGSNNRMVGGAGDNNLTGRSGNDLLTGGAGRDRFVFDSALSATKNLDTVTDFKTRWDQIVLDHLVFTALDVGVGTEKAFVAGTSATSLDHRIIYDSASGALYYDADGTGIKAQIQFAQLLGAPVIGFSDILVI